MTRYTPCCTGRKLAPQSLQRSSLVYQLVVSLACFHRYLEMGNRLGGGSFLASYQFGWWTTDWQRGQLIRMGRGAPIFFRARRQYHLPALSLLIRVWRTLLGGSLRTVGTMRRRTCSGTKTSDFAEQSAS